MTYIQDLASNASLSYSLNFHYMSEFETNPFPANAQGARNGVPIVIPKANTQGEERTLVNAHVSWRDASDKLEITLYGKNLADETYRVAANPVATLWNFSRHGPPREIGMQVGYKF